MLVTMAHRAVYQSPHVMLCAGPATTAPQARRRPPPTRAQLVSSVLLAQPLPQRTHVRPATPARWHLRTVPATHAQQTATAQRAAARSPTAHATPATPDQMAAIARVCIMLIGALFPRV